MEARAPVQILPTEVAATRRPAPLLPRWTAWCYLLSPPFITALIHPQVFSQDLRAIGYNVLAVWIHTVFVGVAIHASFTWLVPRLVREEDSYPRRLAIYSITVLVSVVGALRLSRPLVHEVCVQHEHKSALYDVYTGLLLSAGFLTALVTYERMRMRVRSIELREQRARQAALEAELASLQARTNPHFLFNALNTVAGLIGEDPRRAEDAVERLADLFRYSLHASSRPRVSLGEEMAAVRAYLDMEAMRFEQRLAFRIDVADGISEFQLPPLAVQPLVENAVRHGVEGRKSGSVVVEARADGDRLVVRVRDDGPGPGRSTRVGTRTSLADLRERLRLCYGERAKLDVHGPDGGGCVVELSLPEV